MPRQPKLRSSCDGCGAAKLKCDREQPACGRCLSLDLVCVYGLSRKTGKPPREKLRIRLPGGALPPATSRTPNSNNNIHNNHEHDDTSNNHPSIHDTGALNYDEIVRDCGTIVDDHHLSFRMNSNPHHTTPNHLFSSLLPTFDTPDFDNGIFSDIETAEALQTLATPDSGDYATPATTHTEISQPQIDETRCLDDALMQQASTTNTSTTSKDRSHDCFREACEILNSLSFHRLDISTPALTPNPNLNNTLHCIPSPPPSNLPALSGSSADSSTTYNRIPLDHVLALNREASERLSRLLYCSCASFPQLSMLCASIISQILIWYQHAAGCPPSSLSGPTWSPPDVGMETTSSVSSSSSSSSSSSAAVLMQFSGLVTPGKMAIGSFHIDDMRVQTALKIQLLSGEMRRVGRLIEQFAQRHFEGPMCFADEDYGVHRLYQSLDAWLRGEHSRIAGVMRVRLRELNV